MIDRPNQAEFAPFYAAYVSLVPEADIIRVLEGQAADVRERTRAFIPAREGFRYAEGKWSVREVLGHMTDAERVFGFRAFCFSRGDENPLPGFDENDYVARSGFDRLQSGGSRPGIRPATGGEPYCSPHGWTTMRGGASERRAASPCRCAPWRTSWPVTSDIIFIS